MTIQPNISFSVEEYKSRLAKAKELMKRKGIDALLVHNFPNICYLSGYQSWNTADYYVLVVPIKGEPILVLWASELTNAILTSWVTQTRTYPTRGDPVALTLEILKDLKLGKGRIGLELDTQYLNALNYNRITKALPEAEFADCSGLVQELRVIKSRQEIEYMREAAKLTTAGMHSAVEHARTGGTDQEIAAAAYHAMIGSGSQYMCIPPVVSAGFQSGIPHSTHRGIVLGDGDTTLLEMSGCIHRYNAPLMRTTVIGQPNETVKRMADAILTTLNLIIEAMVPGKSFNEVAIIGEAAIAKAGDDLIFHHTFAYSVGLGYPPTWADCPVTIVQGDERILQSGMTFHLPISLRKEGLHGVALSETVLITESGNEVLTHLDRRLFQC